MRERGRLGLRLYLAGGAPNSVAAEENLRACLKGLEPGSYDLELIDCVAEPKRALSEGVIVTPLLIKYEPAPVQKIIGTLSNGRVLASVLGLPVE